MRSSIRHMRPAMFILIAAVLASPVSAQAATMTFAQALALAYETNPRLEQERAQLRATDEEVSKAAAGWRPNAYVSGSYGWTENDISTARLPIPNGHPRDVTVTINQPLLNGTVIPQTRQASAQVRAGRAQLASIEQSVLLAAARAYFAVVADEATLQFRRDNRALLEGQLSMTRERARVRDVTVADLQLVQARLSSATADVSFAEARLAASRAAFLRAVGSPANTLEPAPALPSLPETAGQALARAVETNPDLNAAREYIRAADASVDAATGSLLPSLSLLGQYRQSRDEIGIGVQNSSVAVLGQIRVPLYQAGAEYAGIRQAKDIRSRASFALGDAERQVQQSVQTVWQAQLAARSAVTSYEQQVAAAQMAYEGFSEGVRVGERSTYDLLNSAQEVVSSRISLAQAIREYYAQSFELLAAMGGMTAAALKLPVKLYDPQAHYNRNAGRWIGFGN